LVLAIYKRFAFLPTRFKAIFLLNTFLNLINGFLLFSRLDALHRQQPQEEHHPRLHLLGLPGPVQTQRKSFD
jgi:hypothetical protein